MYNNINYYFMQNSSEKMNILMQAFLDICTEKPNICYFFAV